MTKELFDEINKIGIYKWDKEIFVCPCKTTDLSGEENEQTLIILTSNGESISIDIPTEKSFVIDELKSIEKSRYVLDKVDILKTFNPFELRMGVYDSVEVRNPMTQSLVKIRPNNMKEHFFYNTRPTKIRLVFGKMDNTINR